jgi:TonB family protein
MVPKTIKPILSLLGPDRRKAIMRISLGVSLLCHVGLVVAFQKAFPFHLAFEPIRTYRVELIRPPVDPSATDEAGGADLAKIRPIPETAPPDTEDTISLDTHDKRYSSYAKVIKSVLMRQWEYPREARENLIEGKLMVLFTLMRSGQLQDLKTLEPSGYDILDREATRAIRSAAPFPPFPPSVTVARLHVKARFDYRLTNPGHNKVK